MAAREDMLRDKMMFLDISSDPNSSATEKDFSNNVLRKKFTPCVQNKGGSTKSNRVFAAYPVHFLKATQFASAKAMANRHLASSHGASSGSSTSGGSGSSPPNLKFKTQLKKKATVENKTAAGAEDKAGKTKEFKRKAKGDPVRE